MYDIPKWPTKTPMWTAETLALVQGESVTKTPNVKLEELLQKSENFPISFPIDSVRCKEIKNSVATEILENNINSAYPLIHENALILYAQFILHKRKYGSSIEKELYKDMTVLDLVQRFLFKRAVMFMGRFDSYILIDRTKGAGKWNLIGKEEKKSKLTLENCISYDEIKLSVFLSVSSYSYFINDGTRKNFGKVPANRNNIQDKGIVIGVIGARLKKVGAMEYEEMVITKTQNTEANGYGAKSNKSLHSVFANFYEEPCLTYEQVKTLMQNEPNRFTTLENEAFFDNVIFSKRIALSIDTLLLEANHRAKQENTTAYIHVVGIGLGVWKCSPHQEEVFVETFAKRLKSLGENLHSISDVYFSYFNQTKTCGGCKHGEKLKIENHPKDGVTIYISKRDPHVKLSGRDAGKLLVVSYAWDGNALPGNEFWSGKLGSTGDSAAAASTQISEIHNSHINPKVCAANLQVVTPSGLIAYDEYVENLKIRKSK
ncbi:hypothetical protein ILUMI_25816 [Ignelater luminosus]|uniref:Uncharacterized protein n=1 Tax=Ignelater luminosus TaxID=2038154 RepID=A0A8K0C972_IGNLU|nr:hypothetical protein ILUMI_25816 [Ignelater luminosus]